MKKLGFGLMRLPIIGGDHSKINLELVQPMVDMFMAHGYTYFDTAYVYHGGFSEVAFRECVVKKYPRDSFTVTTKLPLFGKPDRAGMEKIFAESMERLGVDYIDYYWLHAMGRDSYAHAVAVGAFDYLRELKAAGKIRHMGFSFHDSPETLEKILTEQPDVEFVQLQINYLDWEDGGVQARRCYEVATAHEKPVIVMEPIKGGSLANPPKKAEKLLKDYNPDASCASWAVRFAASLPNVMVVLSGMSELWQVEDNVSCMDDFKPITDEERAILEKAVEEIKFAIPCTACRYCTDGCPMSINIPEVFAVYNKMKRDIHKKWEAKNDYAELLKTSGSPDSCIGCEQCVNACPQHLEIPKLLAECSADLS